jgi:hypothetical protein
MTTDADPTPQFDPRNPEHLAIVRKQLVELKQELQAKGIWPDVSQINVLDLTPEQFASLKQEQQVAVAMQLLERVEELQQQNATLKLLHRLGLPQLRTMVRCGKSQ